MSLFFCENNVLCDSTNQIVALCCKAAFTKQMKIGWENEKKIVRTSHPFLVVIMVLITVVRFQSFENAPRTQMKITSCYGHCLKKCAPKDGLELEKNVFLTMGEVASSILSGTVFITHVKTLSQLSIVRCKELVC